MQLEKKRLRSIAEFVAANEDRLFKEEALEKESNEYLSSMSRRDLERFLDEISENMASNASFAAELQYWQGLSRRVRFKIAVKKIEAIYRLFLIKNKDQLHRMLEEKKLRE